MPFNSETAREAGKKSKRGPAKITRERQEKILQILEKLDKGLNADLKAIKNNDRVNLWKDLQEYVVPKLQRMEAKIEIDANINTLPFNGSITRDVRSQT